MMLQILLLDEFPIFSCGDCKHLKSWLAPNSKDAVAGCMSCVLTNGCNFNSLPVVGIYGASNGGSNSTQIMAAIIVEVDYAFDSSYKQSTR